MLKAFKKPGSENPDVNQLSRAVEEFVQPIVSNPLLGGRLLEGLTLTATATQIPHSLGRRWKGFQITNNNTGERVFSTTRTLDTQYISLQATGSCTVDVWVF